MSDVIEANGLVVHRGGNLVLNGVDVAVRRGVTALVGPNGSGKSTLLQAIATLLPIAGGSIRVGGERTSTWRGSSAVRRRIGYLPQEPVSLEHLSVAEACTYVAWLKLVPRRKRAAAVDAVIDRFTLGPVARVRLSQLSGGTRRRAYLAQSVVSDPRFLLLDEPTAGIDAEHRAEVHDLVTSCASERTVIFSTHLTGDLVLADRVIALRHGTVVFDGTPDEIRALGAAQRPAADADIENGLRGIGVG